MNSKSVGRLSVDRSERRLATRLVAPSLILLAAVAAVPILYAIWLSLNQYSVITPGLSRFVGLGNYIAELTSSEWWGSFGTTFLFTGVSVVFEMVIGLAMALLLNLAIRGRALIRTVVLVPYAILTVVSAITWRTIFDPDLGLVHAIAKGLGIKDSGVIWLGQEGYALTVAIIADIWKTAPFVALLLLAGLQVIPDELKEAAELDGATTWTRFIRVTLPLLRPAIVLALIFRTLDALRVFDLPYVLARGAYGTETLSVLAYRQLREQQLIGQGSATAILTFLTVMIVSFIYIRFAGGNIRAVTTDSRR